MDINDLFEGVMKIISQYSDGIVAERMQLQMSQIGPGLESKKKNELAKDTFLVFGRVRFMVVGGGNADLPLTSLQP